MYVYYFFSVCWSFYFVCVCAERTTWRSAAWSSTLLRTWRSSGRFPLTSWKTTARTSWSRKKTRRSTSGSLTSCRTTTPHIHEEPRQSIDILSVWTPQPADRLEVHPRGGGADQSLPGRLQRSGAFGVASLLWWKGAGGEQKEEGILSIFKLQPWSYSHHSSFKVYLYLEQTGKLHTTAIRKVIQITVPKLPL